MKFTEFRQNLADNLESVSHNQNRIVIHRRDRPVAALISIEDLKMLEILEDEMDVKMAKNILKDIDSKGTDSWDQVKSELGI